MASPPLDPCRACISSCKGRRLDGPSLDLHRAGGVAKQAAAGSAEGGAVKQSEAILEGVFLSSPILSFARKRKNGKKKKRVLYVGFFSPKGTRTLRWAQYLSCAWQERYWRERTAFRVSEGFFGSVSAHYRSHPLTLALRGVLSDTLDETKRKTERPVNYLVIPNRCAHR